MSEPIQTNMPYGSVTYDSAVVTPPPKKKTVWPIVIFVLLLCAICGFFPMLMMLTGSSSTADISSDSGLSYTIIGGSGDVTEEKLLLAIYIDQPIATAAQDYSESLLSALVNGQYVFGYKLKEDLVRAAEDENIAGVLLIINSPGGTVVGSRAIADGVEVFRQQTGKPVYAYIQDIGASGAYWAAVSADKVYADQGSLIGSIGVLMGPFEYYDKLVSLGSAGTVNGIDITYITGGTYKDFGNPTRKLTEEELSILQKGINIEYDGFVSYVSQRRKISPKVIREDVKALVYGVSEAKRYGLIDGDATYDEALSKLASAAGVSDGYTVVKVSAGSTSFFGSVFGKLTAPEVQTAEKPARTCLLCGKQVALFGNPTDY